MLKLFFGFIPVVPEIGIVGYLFQFFDLGKFPIDVKDASSALQGDLPVH